MYTCSNLLNIAYKQCNVNCTKINDGTYLFILHEEIIYQNVWVTELHTKLLDWV